MILRVIATVAVAALLGQQVGTGTLSGAVTDEEGGMIPGARVAAVRGDFKAQTITNAHGRFHFSDLPSGQYQITVTLGGFPTARRNFTVGPGNPVTWNPVLRLLKGVVDDRPLESDPTDAALARGVYEAVVQHVFKKGDAEFFEVNASSLVVRPRPELDWPTGTRKFPPALLSAMTDAGAQRSVLVRANILPAGARLVTNDQYSAFWNVVGAKRPPRLAVTRVFASADGLDAIVLYDFHCDTLCGGSTLLWMRRASLSSAWFVHEACELLMY